MSRIIGTTLDGGKLEKIIKSRGWTMADAASATGVEYKILLDACTKNRLPGAITLADLIGLSDTFAIPLLDLVGDPSSSAENGGDLPSSDIGRLTNVLVSRDPVLITAICAALDWDLERLNGSVEATNALLHDVGLRVTRTGRHLQLTGSQTLGGAWRSDRDAVDGFTDLGQLTTSEARHVYSMFHVDEEPSDRSTVRPDGSQSLDPTNEDAAERVRLSESLRDSFIA